MKKYTLLILFFSYFASSIFAAGSRSIKTNLSNNKAIDVTELSGSVIPEFEKEFNSVDKYIAPRKKVRGTPLLNKKNVYDQVISDSNLFYRTLLTDEEKVTYDEIYKNINEVIPVFPLKATVSSDILIKITKAVFFDNPEFFYWDGSCSYWVNSDDKVTDVEIKYLNEDYIQEMYDDFWNMSQPIIFYANMLETEMEKVKYVHDFICLSTEYDTESYNANSIGGLLQTAYSAIVEYKTVCAGYSKAFAYYMQQLGIPCSCIYSNGHEWNIIKIEGNYYQIDVTWDDTNEGYPRYFNLVHSDMQQFQLHTLTKECSLLVEKYPSTQKDNIYLQSFGFAPLGTPYTYNELNNIDEDFLYPEKAKIFKDYSNLLKYADSLSGFIDLYYEICSKTTNNYEEIVIVKDRQLLKEIREWLSSSDNITKDKLKKSLSNRTEENILLKLIFEE